jgi:putative transposase
MTSPVKRAFKFRFYPDPEQADLLNRTFGCVRKVYNLALQARTEGWYQRQERVNYNATSAMLTAWKKSEDLAFLNEVSCVPLQQCLRHLQGAFCAFWEKRARYPRFKSKRKSRASVEFTASAFRFTNGELTLAKMTRPLGIVWSRPLPEGQSPSTVTVTRDSAGRWFVSLLCQDTIEAAPATNAAVGIDAGLDHLITLSTGEKVSNPRHERDRWYPSSKVCSACGVVADKMPLNVRTWTCRCGAIHDRDVNAACNILAAGLAVSACGAGVRPQRGNLRAGRAAVKQETRRATAAIPVL